MVKKEPHWCECGHKDLFHTFKGTECNLNGCDCKGFKEKELSAQEFSSIGIKYMNTIHWATLLEYTWLSFLKSCGVEHIEPENRKLEFIRKILYELFSPRYNIK